MGRKYAIPTEQEFADKYQVSVGTVGKVGEAGRRRGPHEATGNRNVLKTTKF